MLRQEYTNASMFPETAAAPAEAGDAMIPESLPGYWTPQNAIRLFLESAT
jgi:hypothetical protein